MELKKEAHIFTSDGLQDFQVKKVDIKKETPESLQSSDENSYHEDLFAMESDITLETNKEGQIQRKRISEETSQLADSNGIVYKQNSKRHISDDPNFKPSMRKNGNQSIKRKKHCENRGELQGSQREENEYKNHEFFLQEIMKETENIIQKKNELLLQIGCSVENSIKKVQLLSHIEVSAFKIKILCKNSLKKNKSQEKFNDIKDADEDDSLHSILRQSLVEGSGNWGYGEDSNASNYEQRNDESSPVATNETGDSEVNFAISERVPEIGNYSERSGSLLEHASEKSNLRMEESFKSPDSREAEEAKNLVFYILEKHLEGPKILGEIKKSNVVKDSLRRKIVNILVSHMLEAHRELKIIPSAVKCKYALGVVTCFPSLRDPYGNLGYETMYDPVTKSGFLEWRLKTCRRSMDNIPRARKREFSAGPTAKRICSDLGETGSDEEGIINTLFLTPYNSSNASVIFELMEKSFKQRELLRNSAEDACSLLNKFPRFEDTPGLVSLDFALMFPERSSKLLEKWPKFKTAIMETASENLLFNSSIDVYPILNFDGEGNEVWNSDHNAILMLLRLLPPPSSRSKGRESLHESRKKIAMFAKEGVPLESSVSQDSTRQPFLIGVGQTPQTISKYFIAIAGKFVKCGNPSFIESFDELFKAHFVFSVSYENCLNNFYQFLQTTIYGIDKFNSKETPRIKEIRAKVLSKMCE